MKENQYIIISKTTLEKRIEELDKELLYHTEWYKKAKERYHEERKSWSQADDGEMRVASDAASTTAQEMKILKQVLSQSVPLIPEIEKAFDAGIDFISDASDFPMGDAKKKDSLSKEDYISNLKLDI